MKQFVIYMKEGKKFESHHDVPETVRQQLYAKAGQRTERHRKSGRSLSGMLHRQSVCINPSSNARTYVMLALADASVSGYCRSEHVGTS